MPVNVYWQDDTHTIVRQDYIGKWMWQDFIAASEAEGGAIDMMKSVPHLVNVIADYTQSGPLPMGSAIAQARTVINHYPANWGTLVVVSPQLFVRTLVTAYRRAFFNTTGSHVYAAATLEEAYRLIQKYVHGNPMPTPVPDEA